MFFIRRYLMKLSALKWLLIFALIPAVVYLAAAAGRADRFTVTQKVKIAPEAPLALSGSPSEYAATDWFLVHQEALFQDMPAVQALGRELNRELSTEGAMYSDTQLYRMIKRTMSLSYQNSLLLVTYRGADQDMGRTLAAYFSGRVIQKSVEGLRRQESGGSRVGPQEGRQAPAGRPELSGGPTVAGERALWRGDRLVPALLLLLAGIAAVLVLIGILELADTSLKSERQVARFLHLPVLGSVPDLNRVSKTLGGAKA